MLFAQLHKDKKEALVGELVQRHGWGRERAIQELEAMDEVALAYIGVERRLAGREKKDYDPFQDYFKVR